jgi:hypothetical protein
VEYYRDIKLILQRSCAQCHSINGNAADGLVLDDTTVVDGYENTYNRLANDSDAQYGIPPIISTRTWRQTNASRYIRTFQSRRSLLMWKIMGRRLGCPISTQDDTLKANLGWFVDDLRPVPTVSLPAGRHQQGPLTVLRFGAYDSYPGLDHSSISVTANFSVNGQSAGTELAPNFQETSPYVWTLPLVNPIASLTGGRLIVRVKDLQANWPRHGSAA